MISTSFHMRSIIGIISSVFLLSLTACSSVNEALSPDRVDYQQAGQQTGPSLTVPPDIPNSIETPRYKAPQTGASTLAEYQREKKTSETQTASNTVTPQIKGVEMMREGQTRWLVVSKTPQELWPLLQSFWQSEEKVKLTTNSPESGLMETDWAENRAKLPQTFLRNLLGRLSDAFYSTSQLDRFRTRIESDPKGGTDIYITHQRMVEVYTNTQQDTTKWQPAPRDTELEAVFLRRLAKYLGTPLENANTEKQKLDSITSDQSLALKEPAFDIKQPFDRAWRDVGVSLDRANFTIEDRDRSKGIYYVRYVDPVKSLENRGAFFKLFHSKEVEASKQAEAFQINVKDNGESARITVLNKDGQKDSSTTAIKIATILRAALN